MDHYLGDVIHHGPEHVPRGCYAFLSSKWTVYGTQGQQRKAVPGALEIQAYSTPHLPNSIAQDKIRFYACTSLVVLTKATLWTLKKFFEMGRVIKKGSHLFKWKSLPSLNTKLKA